MRYAQILNNKLHWIFETDETLEQLKNRFAPDIVFVEVGPEVQEGWDWDGKKAIPPKPVDPLIAIREKRNQLLVESDWTQLPDVALATEQKTAWAVYRQQLRDFPEKCDPLNPIWPTAPSI
jgi:hypothetical protein